MSHRPRDPAAFLRHSLRANAVFSAVSGLVFAAGGASVARLLGVEPALLVTFVGINLIAFAAALVYVASRPLLSPRLAVVIIALDVAWVLGTGFLVYVGAFTGDGALAALAVADVVLVFAVLQGVGLHRLTRAGLPA